MDVYMFPGQGSQQKGMGKELFSQYREYVERADSILGYSIETLCLDDPQRVLAKTEYTQPALFVVNALNYLHWIENGGRSPQYLLGHSLGEYNALFAAGVLDFETGLRLVKKRGQLMASAPKGGMAAVLKCDIDAVKQVIHDENLHEVDIANINGKQQVVISGPLDVINKSKSYFEKIGAMLIPLNVSSPFHSRYMEGAMKEFEKELKRHQYGHVNVPVISNYTAEPYSDDLIVENLKQQICGAVNWVDSIRYLMGLGDFNAKELGPGDVLTKLTARIREDFPPIKSKKIYKNPKSITAERLGCKEFKQDYKLKYAYVGGSMYKGIASKEMVIKLGESGCLGFLGIGGLSLDRVEEDIRFIKTALNKGQAFGVNLLHQPIIPAMEMRTVDIFLKHDIRVVEASAYMQVTAPLVKYRLKGLRRGPGGDVIAHNKVMAKVSRPEVATEFMNSAPERIVKKLLADGEVTRQEAELSIYVPMADDICAEADSGGHTDAAVASTLIPSICRLRDQICEERGYSKRIRIGAAGGIGSPESVSAAFVLGADFVLTGSINQCSPESGVSETVKDMLQSMNIQDTDYAPAGDMFEIGARVQVLKKGVFFPARANKLYDLWRFYDCWEDIDQKIRNQIESKYFKRSFDEVYVETKNYYQHVLPGEIEKAERNAKHKMALVFRWYFVHSSRLALSGDSRQRVDYQVHVGPALGAFNNWVKGTDIEPWQNRNVDTIAIRLMEHAANHLNRMLYMFA